jgi:hypothetical protein
MKATIKKLSQTNGIHSLFIIQKWNPWIQIKSPMKMGDYRDRHEKKLIHTWKHQSTPKKLSSTTVQQRYTAPKY